MSLRRRRSFTLSSEKFPNSNKLQLVHWEYNPNTVKKWSNSSTLRVIYDGIYARSGWSADSSVFRQTVGMDPGSNLFAFPSMWNNLLKQSLLKCSEQTMNRPLGLKFFRCKLSISRPLFASDQCREIPVAGCDELLQPWTTQRLIMPQEHAENNNYLVVFRRSKYTHFSQRKLPLCILN